MTDPELAERVLARLHDGRWHLLHGLAAAFVVPRRAVEQAIEDLRLAGQPIIGGSAGVRLSDRPSEVREYAQQRRRRSHEISKGTRQLLHTANRMEGRGVGQRTLWNV